MSKGRLIFDLQKWFWMDVLITSTYGRLLDDLDRRHKNFHFQTILSWSHNVYDKPPTDVIWRYFAHWVDYGLHLKELKIGVSHSCC